ncbi:MAG: D-alanine--D-alanine ligase [Betaproteobacteria bacterium AqS2]|uniref:D-alanine--D-alanine ligase n=1 Tax=Candidatus Amphirhobacter heronislandensis TaxID=1732024 RepID=A0A930UHZ2_9GAMM|nr:D-alanine--D-alanine ligase [Betaproteobacteria bacterium AqS2]
MTASAHGRVVLLEGGVSPEREVSLQSGANLAPALAEICAELVRFDPQDRSLQELAALKPDCVFNILHGGPGENGEISAALAALGLRATGSGARASMLAMDKRLSKLVWEDEGLGTPQWLVATDATDATLDSIQLDLGDAVFIKPNSGGSSISAGPARGRQEIAARLAAALADDPEAMVEQLIEGVEVTYGIVGDRVLPGIRIEVPQGFYDYEAKYVSDDTRFICPPELPGDLDARARAAAQRAYASLGCRGWGRVDLIVSGQDIQLLEVNTVPGMTSHSLVPLAARKDGMELPALLAAILKEAA